VFQRRRYLQGKDAIELTPVVPDKKNADEIIYVMTGEKENGEKGEAFEDRSCTISHTR